MTRDGADVRLTPTEWKILEVLVRNPEKLITQQQQTLAKAEAIQSANLFLDVPETVNTNWRRYAAVTVDDVKRVAGKYLRPENALVLLITAGAGQ